MATINHAYWLADADGGWSTGGNWATQVPGSNPATYTATVPSGNYNVSLTPDDPVAGMATGTDPFTITYNTAGTITSLEGPAFATLAIQGGTLTITATLTDSGPVTMAAGTLDIQNAGGATSSIGGGLTQTGSTLKVDAGTLSITGASSIGGTVAGAGTVMIGGGGTIVSGTKATVARLVVGTSGTTLTLGGNLAYAGAFKQQSGTALALTGGYLLLTGTANLSGATINGSKTFYAEGGGAIGGGLTIGGTVTFFNTKNLSQAGGTVMVGDTSGGGVATLSNAAGAFYVITDDSGIGHGTAAGSRIVNRGALRKTGGTGTSTVGASFIDTGTVAVTTGTLSFTGRSNSFAGAITGAGKLQFAGGSTTIASGTTASVATLSIAGSGTGVTLAEDLTYAGAFTQGAGSNLTINAGDTLTLTGMSSLGGRVSGAGTLTIAGGSATIAGVAAFFVANLALTGQMTNVTLDRTVSYGGTYSQSGATLTLDGGHSLVLTGTATFTNAAVVGAADSFPSIYAAGTTTIAGLTMSGFSALQVSQTVIQAGGDLVTSDSGAPLVISAQGVYDITDDSDIVGQPSTNIVLDGLLEKTGGSGTSLISNLILSTGSGNTAAHGTVTGTSGTLEFGGDVLDIIALNIGAGATMAFDGQVGIAGHPQFNPTASFIGDGATLQLNDAQRFSANITGFSGTDTIDLRSITFASATTMLDYNGKATSGTLTVSDGSRTASLAMLGSYTQSSFHLATDSHGGSAVTFA